MLRIRWKLAVGSSIPFKWGLNDYVSGSDVIRLILMILALSGAFACGLWLGRKKRKVWLPVAFACLGLIAFRYVLNFRTDIEYALFPYDFYVEIRWLWDCVGTLALFGIGYMNIPSRVRRDAVLVVAGLLFVYVAWQFGFVGFETYEHLNRFPPTSEDYWQTTDYTCGPAAAAIFLWMHGINASEQELAREAQTTSTTGTCEFAMAKILRIHAEPLGFRVKILCPSLEKLSEVPLPFLTTLKLTYWVDHWMVVRAVTAEKVVVCDPMSRAFVMLKSEFQERWRGVAVTVVREDEGLSGDPRRRSYR